MIFDMVDVSVQTTEKTISLRDRQKNRRRAIILAAAKDLFSKQGYSSTNMEDIAEQAEVGVATVYNYFGSKGRLLADIFRPDFEILFEQGARLIRNPPEDPIVAVLSLVDIYRHFQSDWRNRDVLQAVLGPGLSAEPVLDELAEYSEKQVKQQIEELILGYQKCHKVRTSIDANDAAMIIFFIFNQHFIEYVIHDVGDFDQMKKIMDRQISFIVSALLPLDI
ncbi:MAG: TetR/AcrR family transcriptional regulator [Emcibacter sp.]|nr:TetR/AcrR family transcriptional regulator [Emcibacter sp.]